VAARQLKAAATADAAAVTAQLTELNARKQAALAKVQGTNAEVLAMFTGLKSSGLEVWDCGRRLSGSAAPVRKP
jgi:hypothetical protein